METIDQIRTWLESAGLVADSEFDLSALPQNQRAIVAADLDGIYDSARAMDVGIRRLLDGRPTGEALEDLLFEFETHVKHINWHWQSLVTRLQSLNLWPGDDDGE